MKKILALLLTFSFFYSEAQIEYSLPEIPRKIEYANVIINLDKTALRKANAEVVALLTPQNSYLDAKLELMQWYFPIIEKILEEENVPEDLKYLVVQESDLKPNALSSSAAVGFWQFKEATGKELGLRIDNDLDERKYIYSSTMAAAKYFKKNNIIFKNWISCIYAYNQGPTGASKELPTSWLYASEVSFNKDTPDYLITALAHRIAYEHRLNRLKRSSKTFVEYEVNDRTLAEIAVQLTVDLEELRKYNAWLYAPSVPTNKDYTVLISARNEDVARIQRLIDERNELSKGDRGYPKVTRTTMVTTSADDPVFFDINNKKGLLAQPGNEAAQMARKGGISLAYFLKFNDLSDRDMIKTGEVYYLQPKAKKGFVEFHTVAVNQTLWDVSQIYGIQLRRLLKFNRLKSVEPLQAGRILWLQKKRPKNEPIRIIQEVIDSETEPLKIPIQEPYEAPVAKTKAVITSPPEVSTAIPEPVTTVEEKPEVTIAEIKSAEIGGEKAKPVLVKRPAVTIVEKELLARPETKSAINIVKTDEITEKRNIEELTNAEPLSDDRVHLVIRGETFYSISRMYNMTINKLVTMNQTTRNSIVHAGQYLIIANPDAKLVKEVKETNQRVEDMASVANSETVFGEGIHLVKRGETFYSISKKYNMTINELVTMNKTTRNSIVHAGQYLIISESLTENETNVSERAFNNAPLLPTTITDHVVKKGETLYSISKTYDTSVKELQNLNASTGTNIYVGQRLKVTQREAQTTFNSSSHKVTRGQTLYAISRLYGVSVAQLKTWNNLRNNTISIGKVLEIRN